jgi:hypothetical protein
MCVKLSDIQLSQGIIQGYFNKLDFRDNNQANLWPYGNHLHGLQPQHI